MTGQPPSKSVLRQMFLERRALIPPAARKESAAKVCELFFKNVPVPAGAVVAGYWPIRNELDDMPILRELLRRGCSCALPHVAGATLPLEFHLWDEATPMTAGKYSIMEPAAAPAVVPDIVLVPLAAFDANCHRLGYGGGFYDATIARLKENRPLLAIGLGYEMQLCAGLPVEEGDIRMDMIVTDGNIYK
ncbi:MAG: 5-formyltetrahydrofolate cyclo-ligase [Alphaproteobacteria bacterium]|nr:5-formyltetrahydrofolate cyclo-ligase [Alphaproteobacteria bacterium]